MRLIGACWRLRTELFRLFWIRRFRIFWAALEWPISDTKYGWGSAIFSSFSVSQALTFSWGVSTINTCSFICREKSPYLKRAILFSEGGSFLAGFSPLFFHKLQKFKTVDGGTRIHAGVFLRVHRDTCLITQQPAVSRLSFSLFVCLGSRERQLERDTKSCEWWIFWFSKHNNNQCSCFVFVFGLS